MNKTHWYIGPNGELATSDNYKNGYKEVTLQEWLEKAIANHKNKI